LSLNKLKSLNRIKDFLDEKIQEIDTELTKNNSQFKQNSLLLQRKILQSFKTSTLHNIKRLEKGKNYDFK
jgi:predicted DNA-binding transcriptional regulator